MALNEAMRAQRELLNQSTNLLKLPAELRDAIYIKVLPPDPGIYPQNNTHRPNILRVSRRIRKEVSSLFYGQYQFHIIRQYLPLGQKNCSKLYQPMH